MPAGFILDYVLLSSVNAKNRQKLNIQSIKIVSFPFVRTAPWSARRPVQMERSNWGLEGVGKFCGNGETGESQQWRRRIPKSAASGQILQIGGNGEGPRRAVGENAMSCPRLNSVLASSSSSSSPSPYKSSGPCKPESLLGEIPPLVQTRLDGRFEESGQILTILRFYRYRPKCPWIWKLWNWC